jgi:hypothetical protein
LRLKILHGSILENPRQSSLLACSQKNVKLEKQRYEFTNVLPQQACEIGREFISEYFHRPSGPCQGIASAQNGERA